jgi:16S rRNA (guanine527-N7)-methyltransferase
VVSDLALGIEEEAFGRMLQHERLLQAWNRRINLTRIVEPREVAQRHFGEALFLAREAQLSGAVADLGAGAGFPGLPIAATCPQIEMLEVESVAKKATFMREVTRGWSNVRVSLSRIEDLKGTFDWIIMRAVAVEPLVKRLAELAPRCALLVGLDSAASLEGSGIWTITRRIPVPWSGPGELLIAHRADF